ncbi:MULTISPECIES: response regulator [Sphingobacterium]|uniref:Response regulator n=1 Tax=Sphingobacterium corticibacter TaxID=2171749 RepID=A0A2T8HI78_9SPHI|nr:MULTISPECIES: response regulator [Sphingobacterium]PVH25115.1 response regulator [Sphingobacterium corticibacter]
MAQKKVFICDDDKGITDMLEMVLELEDVDTITETDSIYAYDKMIEFKPDILIVDLWMPVVTGDQLIKKIRASEELKHIFIICISASRDGLQVANEAGANTFIAKPFDVDEFLTTVENAVISAA